MLILLCNPQSREAAGNPQLKGFGPLLSGYHQRLLKPSLGLRFTVFDRGQQQQFAHEPIVLSG